MFLLLLSSQAIRCTSDVWTQTNTNSCDKGPARLLSTVGARALVASSLVSEEQAQLGLPGGAVRNDRLGGGVGLRLWTEDSLDNTLCQRCKILRKIC